MEDELFIIQLFAGSDENQTLTEGQLLLEILEQEDEEEIEQTQSRKRPKNTNYLEVVSEYSDAEFKGS